MEKGVNAIVLHPRIGIPKEVEYLSSEYFKAVRFIVKTASELGMKIVLYDEGMYPSGSAHGMVVAENPDFASRGIRLAEKDELVPRGAEVVVKLSDGRKILYDFTGGTIRGIHFGEDDGEAGAPKSADILNKGAVETFIRLTHERYYEEIKEYFGGTVIAFFTDEPCALGRNAGGFREWAPGMGRELQEAGETLSDLEGLFTGQENSATKRYRQLVKKHLRETFYAPLSRWCQDHGIVLMGHPAESDDIEEELYFHIPGQDLIMRRVSPESGGLLEFDSVQAKLSADIARHLGRRRNANECFGVCCRDHIPWYFTGGDMKWYIDWLGMRGVNMYVPHAFYYSVSAGRGDERPPDVGPNNIWWPYYGKFSGYMKRMSGLMTDSRVCAKVAVLCDNNCVPYGEIACLYENQIGFHYLPMTVLSQGRIEKGRLCVGDYAYEVVLNLSGFAWEKELPDGNAMDKEESGVRVETQPEKLIQDKSLRTVLTNFPCRDLRVSRLEKDFGEPGQEEKKLTVMYLFSNEGEEELSVRVNLQQLCAERPQRQERLLVFADLWKGEAGKLPGTFSDFLLHLFPRETLLVIPDWEERAEDNLEKPKEEVFLGDFTDCFTLAEKKGNSAVYRMCFHADMVNGGETFLVRGEEMAECFCNGRFVDVSFWRPHRFNIGPFLREGENELKLAFTGNAANLYQKPGKDIQVPFGLEQ